MEIRDLKSGMLINLQEPQQRFSHNTYRVKELKVILICENGDGTDGIEVEFTEQEIKDCRIMDISLKG